VAAVARGSPAAFEALYERHCPGMLALARQLLDSPSEAEDAVQQAFTSAYRELSGRGVRPEFPRAWLYAITRNRCLNAIRDRREVASESARSAEPSTIGLAEEVERRSDLRDLLKAMHRLPEEQRTALALFELGGLSQTEIAQALDCSPHRVKALVHQARTNLAHARAASQASCESIRQQLAVLRGGRLNSGELRTHVRDCEGCADYALMVRDQRRRLAVVLPVVPLIAMKLPAIAGLTSAGGGLGGGALGSAVGRKLMWLRPRPTLGFAAAGTASVAAAGAIAVGVVGSDPEPPPKEPERPAAVAPAAPAPATAAAAKPVTRSRPGRATRRRTGRRAAPAARPPAPAQAPAPEPAAAPVAAATPGPPAGTPSPPPASSPPTSPAPAAPPAQPGQDFDLVDPGPPPGAQQETPASQTEPVP
jgi:RNA polymerase sigma factor (sigma-70 family)